MDQSKTQITGEQILGAAQAGVQLLNLRSTLIPGDIKTQLAVLEVVLQNIIMGVLTVAPPVDNQLNSDSDGGQELTPAQLAKVAGVKSQAD